MKYQIKKYNHTLNINGKTVTKVEDEDSIQAGDIVQPHDGSWSLLLVDGEMEHDSIAYPPKTEDWKVVATECILPIEPHDGSEGYSFPAPYNDTIICKVSNPSVVCFTRQVYLHKVDKS